MNKAFQECRDRLLDDGLTEAQTRDLTDVTMHFRELMKSKISSGNIAMTSQSPQIDTEPLAVMTVTVAEATTTTTMTTCPQDQTLVNSPKNNPDWPDLSLMQPLILPHHAEIDTSFSFNTLETYDLPVLSDALQPLHAPQTATLDPTAPIRRISVPATFPFHHTSLARRLHRSCIEAAYHLLLDPSRRLHTYERVFRVALLAYDRDYLAATFEHILEFGPDEPLESWDGPQIRIGGAGLHYQHRQSGSGETRRPVLHLGKVEPQALGLLQSAMLERTVDLSVEVTGIEGMWFDPYDIEGYLEERGVQIDPTVSFVEAEIKRSPSEESENSSPATFPVAPAEQGSWNSLQWSNPHQLHMNIANWEQTTGAPVTSAGSVALGHPVAGSSISSQNTSAGISEVSRDWQDSVAPTVFGHTYEQANSMLSGFAHEHSPPISTKSVIIDVAKFVQCKSSLIIVLYNSRERQC